MGKATAIALSKFGPVLIGGRSEKKLNEAMEEMLTMQMFPSSI